METAEQSGLMPDWFYGLMALAIHAVVLYFLSAPPSVVSAPEEAAIRLSFPVVEASGSVNDLLRPQESVPPSSLQSASAAAAASRVQSLPLQEQPQNRQAVSAALSVNREPNHRTPQPQPPTSDKDQPSLSKASRPASDQPALRPAARAAPARVVYKPGVKKQTPPVYPPRAIALGQEGKVLLDVRLRGDGRPDKLRLLRSSGYPLLDTAALDSVKNWLFHSPHADGQPQPGVWVRVPVRFELR